MGFDCRYIKRDEKFSNCLFIFFKLGFKIVIKVFEKKLEIEILRHNWAKNMNELPDWAHSIIVLPDQGTCKGENG